MKIKCCRAHALLPALPRPILPFQSMFLDLHRHPLMLSFEVIHWEHGWKRSALNVVVNLHPLLIFFNKMCSSCAHQFNLLEMLTFNGKSLDYLFIDLTDTCVLSCTIIYNLLKP